MRPSGITADSGFLIGVERRKQRAKALLDHAVARHLHITVPVAALAEWWRAGRRQARLLAFVQAEEMTERLAKTAGEALAAVPGATVVDAVVMASAASRGDVVYTSDFEDLGRLGDHFRSVKVLVV
jgi:hypothetical protein